MRAFFYAFPPLSVLSPTNHLSLFAVDELILALIKRQIKFAFVGVITNKPS